MNKINWEYVGKIIQWVADSLKTFPSGSWKREPHNDDYSTEVDEEFASIEKQRVEDSYINKNQDLN